MTNVTSTGTCFNVTAANVTINCNGFTITGNNASSYYGITTNAFNTTIKNCNIQNFSTGDMSKGDTFKSDKINDQKNPTAE